LYYCNVCSEKWFLDNSEIEDTYVCQRCQKNPISFTDINDMDPLKPSILTHGPIYDSFRSEYNMLPSLSNIEECLIARNAVIMQAFHLKGGISFPQKVSYICNVLPRLPSTIKVLIVRCRGSNDEITNAYKDFRVRRNCIQQWLLFLKRWSNPYRDIVISDENLHGLPMDDSIFTDILNGMNSNSIEITGDNYNHQIIADEDVDLDDLEFQDTLDVHESGVSEMDTNNTSEFDSLRSVVTYNNRNLVFNWPQRENVPNDEYELSYLLASSFLIVSYLTFEISHYQHT